MPLNQQGYTSQILASGASEGRQATAEDFGAGIAQGLDSVARGADQVANVGMGIARDQGNIWAATAASQKELAVRQQINDHVNSLDPTAPDYPAQVAGITDYAKQAVTQAQQDLTEQAPDRFARRFVDFHMGRAGVRIADGAMGLQSKLNADYTTGLVNQGIKADTDLISASPDNDTYARLLQKQHDTIVGLTTVGPDVKASLLSSVQHTYAKTQAYSAMSMDPQGFLRGINLAGGVTTRTGAPVGGVPTQAPGDGSVPPPVPAQPDMLAFANQQLAAGKSQDEAMQALMAKYPDRADKFRFNVPKGGDQFVDMGTSPSSQDPQVQPLTDQAIAASSPPLAGWKNLGFDEKVQLVRQAEGLVSKQLASNRGSTTVQMQDAVASLSAGQDYPDLDNLKAANRQYLSADQAQRNNDLLDSARAFGGFKAQVATMPDATAQAWIDQNKPQGGNEFAVKEPLYNQAVAALASAQKERRDAPVDYAVQHGIAGAQPLDFSSAQNFGAGLRQRVAVNATMTHDYGAPDQIFTKNEVDTLDQAVSKLPAKQAVVYLGSIASSLGNTRDFGTAMNQLGHKNPMLAYAGGMANSGATVMVNGQAMAATDIAAKVLDGDRILNGRALDTSKADDLTVPAGANAVKLDEKQFQAAFDSAIPPQAFQSPDATRSAGQQKDIFNAVKSYYVADALQQGKPLTQIDPKAVATAVQAVTGGTARMGNGGVLMAPFGMKMDDFQSQWNPRMSRALTAAGYGADEIARSADKLRPINLADGRYGFMSGTQPLIDRHTKQIVTVDYRQPYTPPAAPVTPPDAPIPGLATMRRY